ncbi:hypothetical protein BELL_0350g00050 [Botrytis elliptica]|uniref:Uncharacterized protein n=1 Tax=Botrytis elliptica TaxID=278938 RepID=A0A4Z1JJR7_9HELO|nr:hypothetical protein EAE99_011264 [Botrytis elliptica]TGO73564.1 hypothetical protein BELL_0350g00050 [Botrytis elliptica]
MCGSSFQIQKPRPVHIDQARSKAISVHSRNCSLVSRDEESEYLHCTINLILSTLLIILTVLNFNASSRKKESPIHTSFPAECCGTQSALDHQSLNHVINLTTPSPPLLLRTSELNYWPISKPFEDTRTTSPTLNESKDTVIKNRLPLPHGSSRDVANSDQYTKRREKSDPIISATRRFFSDPVKQVLSHKSADEYRNHQISKEKQEPQYFRDWYLDERNLQLIDVINGQPLTCKKIARICVAAIEHDIMAKTLARCKEQFAALDLTDQARVIKSSANFALLTHSETYKE